MIADNPDTADVDEKKIYPDAMGYPRDLCHVMSVSGQCAAVTGNSIVGDGIWDARACRSLRMPFVGVASGVRADRLRAEGATLVVPDFAEVEPFLAHLKLIAAGIVDGSCPRASD